MTEEFYLERIREIEDKHDSELTELDRDLLREYAIELDILRLKGK